VDIIITLVYWSIENGGYHNHLIEWYLILAMTWLKITHNIIVFCTLYLTIYLPTNVRLFRYISRFTYRQMFAYFVISHDLPTDKCSFILLCLSIYLSINLRIISLHLTINQSMHLTIYLSIYVRIISLHLTIYLSVNVRIVSLHPTIYLPTNVRLFRYISRFTYRQMFVLFRCISRFDYR
jgi:hypothetical protein